MENEREKNVEDGTALEDVKEERKEDEELSVERISEGEVPSWRKQLTLRAFAVSFLLSVMFCFVVMKLSLTTGIIPSFNVSAGLLGFFFIQTWTKLIAQSGMLRQPFTCQENTVIQTCVIASSGVAFSGGFGSYLFGMSERIAEQSEDRKDAFDYKNPALGWMISFLFVVSFIGLFAVVPMRKIIILDFKLKYARGTETAHLINSFHTPEGAKLAKKQVRALGKFFSFSFLWGFFQWFFTAGEDCGFTSFPTFGLQAYEHKFFFDFSATYVGVGMICPHIINVSALVGGILSWGIMWPLIENRKGHWYPADLPPNSLKGLQGYKIFIGIAMILGDGSYNFVKARARTLAGLLIKLLETKAKSQIPVKQHSSPSIKSQSYDDQRRSQLFLKDQIPKWFAIGGYLATAAISTAILPYIFNHHKWYHIAVIYIFAPTLAFCNAFGCGLTGWSSASMYGKLAILTIGAWGGASHGGVMAPLVACGVIMSITAPASDLMQDFKTGYMTLASPRSIFVSQVIGTAMGCVISPCVFWMFYKAFPDIGYTTSEYPAPFATVYYTMARLGVEGFSPLPKHCLNLCYVFFAAAVLINLIRDILGKKRSWFIPLPMAMGIPFFLGSYFAIDMCVGSLILYIWQKVNKAKADAFGPVVASGLICGDGMWTLPSAILALAGVRPPICMKFISRATNSRVDKYLGS
ncbi:probable metal-nicotianamine transporter YSL7 [Sesamum indicum]|uniref:Probable metal-nicotianamine transporter YSL7 n=1 Tax=Sesamum indicum TaxID=4182 RepID=A0A6I9SPT2_SESIN|nr:probable metal-nicotianamine transporter YSL7 [Sesamum indicum]